MHKKHEFLKNTHTHFSSRTISLYFIYTNVDYKTILYTNYYYFRIGPVVVRQLFTDIPKSILYYTAATLVCGF